MKFPPITQLLVLVFLITTISCQTDDGRFDTATVTISDAPLSGKINGQDFEAVGGKAIDANANEININITRFELFCDNSTFDLDLSISFQVFMEVGTSNDVNVVYWSNGDAGKYNFDSTVIITEISDSHISGKLINKWDDSNYVDGTFRVSNCSLVTK
jgi:hypothetical protein